MEVKVVELLGTHDLALRSWAEELFNTLAEKRGRVLVLDFSGIEFVSRSFAHEYLKRRQSFNATIREKNMNPNVKQMFRLAAQVPSKKNSLLVKPDIIQNL